MAAVAEIAPGLFRFSTYFPPGKLQFNQFLLVDDEPLLFHTGPRAMFADVRSALARVLDPARLRWIGFSHFEADECGALNEWLAAAPHAEPVCSVVGALVSVNDFASRPARALADGEVLATGSRRVRFLQTPHVPHCWEAGLMFEEEERILFCSDLLHQNGEPPPVTSSDLIGVVRDTLLEYQAGPLAHYLPYTPATDATLERLAALEPKLLAVMHGASYAGDGARALRDYAAVLREILGPARPPSDR